jgi:pimeloyl-ACP methyl ester carboxylesterase
LLRSHIEGRERRWHSRDTNRHPRPFDWGTEYIGLEAGSDPKAAIARFSAEAVAASDRFFTPPPSTDYAFDGFHLSFPSPLESADPENNTVHARYFPAGGRLAVIVLPQWNAQLDSHIGLCRILQRFGISSLRLSLPYHDARRPRHMERAEGLVGPNIGQTLATNRQAIMEVRLAADWLERKGYTRLGVLGTSIGSCVGFLAMAHDPRLRYNAFIHVSSMFADVVWTGLSTSHLRETLESELDLDELRGFWAPISPLPFIPRLAGSRNPLLVITGKYDLTFPYELSLQTLDEFARHDIGFERLILPCGHYTMAMFPFREIVGFSVVRFFRRYRD